MTDLTDRNENITASAPPMASFNRGMAILNLIRETGRIRNSRIVDSLGIPESTVYRYCRSLADAGFILEIDGYYVPSEKLSDASVSRRRDALVNTIHPLLVGLTRRTGLSALATTRVHTAAVCLDNVNAPGVTATGSHHRGTVLALHAGASATPLLAWAPDAVVARVVTNSMRRYTTKTPPPEQLLLELDDIRTNGFHVSTGWLDPGRFAVGVPVVRDGIAHCALSLAGPVDAITRTEELIDELRETAQQLIHYPWERQ